MTGSPSSADTPAQMVGQHVCMSRLIDEMKLSVAMSQEVQAAIHGLHLTQADRNSRRALQAIDRLSQSLECLTAALIGMSESIDTPEELDIRHIVKRVYLEDVRNRLMNPPEADAQADPPRASEVDLF